MLGESIENFVLGMALEIGICVRSEIQPYGYLYIDYISILEIVYGTRNYLGMSICADSLHEWCRPGQDMSSDQYRKFAEIISNRYS